MLSINIFPVGSKPKSAHCISFCHSSTFVIWYWVELYYHRLEVKNELLTDLLKHDLLKKLTSPELVKKFPLIIVNRRLISVVTRARYLSLSWTRLIQSIPSHFLKIHLNIILSSAPGYSKWSLSLRIQHQNPLHTFHNSFVLHTPPISFFYIWSPEKYLVRNTDH